MSSAAEVQSYLPGIYIPRGGTADFSKSAKWFFIDSDLFVFASLEASTVHGTELG